jgi:hypothetical protein
MKEKRKDYEKPAIRVVKLQHTGLLMTSNRGGLQNYQWYYYEE